MTSPSNPEGVTGKLCNWVHQVRLSDVPSDVTERAKYLILDGLACAVVAAHLPWSETAANGIFKMEPPGSCTVIGWEGKKLSPLAATLLNSAFTQGFELDDYHSRAPLHSNSLILPALFAVAESGDTDGGEKTSTVVSGEDFLRAYIVGCEVGPRVGLALHGFDLLSRGWHSGAVQGPPATAAAVSSLLKLAPGSIESALGIACTQAGGLMAAQFGSMAKRMQHGFTARNGLFAALMAKEGYTGIEEVFETPYGGYLSCFSQGANFQPASLPEEIAGELGSRWELRGIRVKLHAAMAALHGAIDAVETLQKQHPERFDAAHLDDIASITTRLGRAAYEHGGWVAPPNKELTTTAAQMSVQYAVAAQLLDREVLMSQFGAAKLNRPGIRTLMAKNKPVHDESMDQSKSGSLGTTVEIRFKDGTDVEAFIDAPKGVSPPVSNDEIVDKWRKLVQGVLDDSRRDAIEKKVLALESVGDIRELLALLEGNIKCPIDV